jgi:lysophospholipase
MLAYEPDVSNGVILNGMRSLTLNGSISTWSTCLACALTDRAYDYTSANRTSQCQSCFDTFCWAGDDNTTRPNEYEPVLGTVPEFFTKKNLVNGTTTATAATQTTEGAKSGAERVMSVSRGCGWVSVMAVIGGMALLL